MKKIKKLFLGVSAAALTLSFTAVNSFAATADLPDMFSDLSPIIELILKIVEFISKIASIFA